MFKFMHDIDEIDKANRFHVIQSQVRGHSVKYHRKISRKQHRYNFFFYRTANLWNSLPIHLVSALTANSNKAKFDDLMSIIQLNSSSKRR